MEIPVSQEMIIINVYYAHAFKDTDFMQLTYKALSTLLPRHRIPSRMFYLEVVLVDD